MSIFYDYNCHFWQCNVRQKVRSYYRALTRGFGSHNNHLISSLKLTRFFETRPMVRKCSQYLPIYLSAFLAQMHAVVWWPALPIFSNLPSVH